MPNSRMLTLQQSTRFFFKMLFWLPVTVFSLLLIYNTVPYFSFSKNFSFIEERSLLFENGVYHSSFYIHIFAGAFCILTALVQFSRIVLKKAKAIHRWSGRVYVFVVLFLGAPTGLYLSFFAKGSIYGLNTILKKNVLAHKVWMIRSYAMTMTAVTFRVYHIVFYLLGWDHLKNYELSLWISVLGNMLIAEWIIYRKSKSYLQTFSTS